MAELKKKMPRCIRCQGTNWVDLGVINPETGEHLYECGGGVAHTDPNEFKNGCMRVIITTLLDMEQSTEI